MPASFNVHNGLVDITLIWPNVESARAQEIVFGCALYRWRLGEGPTTEVDGDMVQVPFENLTTQQKLDLAYHSAQKLIVAEAKASLVQTDIDVARAAALAYADTNYELPE